MQKLVVVSLAKFRHNRIIQSLIRPVDWGFVFDQGIRFFLSIVSFVFGFYFALDSFLPALLGINPQLNFTHPFSGFIGVVFGYTFIALLGWSVGLMLQLLWRKPPPLQRAVVPPPSVPDVGDYDPRQVRM